MNSFPLKLRKDLDYLDMRNGKLNYHPGFAITADPLEAKPSLILEESIAPNYNLSSSAVFTHFDFAETMEL